jgi:type III secretion protein J
MRSFVARLLLLAVAVLAGCSYELQHNLNEDDANQIYTLLSKNGISAKKAKEEGGNEPTYMIAVAKTDAAQATELLREHSLPRQQQPGWESITKNKGMIPTEMEQRAMGLQALQGEIDRGLNKIDGILDVHVIPMQPENVDLTQPDKKPLNSVAVLVKYKPNAEGRPPIEEQAIRSWVAAASPDTRPEQVKVILTQSQPTSQELTEASRLVSVLGMQMTAASASQFKLLILVIGGVMTVMIALTLFLLLRGPSAAQARPRRG